MRRTSHRELTNKLDDITEREEVTGAHQGEHLIAHPNYIGLVDGIQDLVDEFGTDEDEFEAEDD